MPCLCFFYARLSTALMNTLLTVFLNLTSSSISKWGPFRDGKLELGPDS